MTDPIADIIGDYRAFATRQRDRLLARGIDIAPFELSHLAFRVPEWDQRCWSGTPARTPRGPAAPVTATGPNPLAR